MTNPAVIPFPARRTRVALRDARSAEREKEARTKNQIDRTARVLDRLEARQAGHDLQIAALERRKKSDAARQARIEKRALALMAAAGLKQLVGFRRTLERRESGVPKLIVDDESLIPANWMRQPKPAKAQPDKLGMKKALDEDPELAIPGVHLAQTVSLQRK